MDHQDVIKALPPETRAALTRRRNGPGLARLAVHFGLIAVLATAVALKAPYWGVLLAPLGVLIVFLFTLMHETVHETPFRTLWLNRWVGRLCGVILIIPYDWFRYFHLAHHRWTQDPERDPELASPHPTTIGGYIWRLTGAEVWRGQITTLLAMTFGRTPGAYAPPSAHRRLHREARAQTALYIALAAASMTAGSEILLWCWIVPALIGQPFLRFYLMAEHGRCPMVANMLENTRTTFTNRIVRWIAWNMPYHAEHHAFPTAPFHQLPALHAEIAAHLRVTERGYGRFHRKLVGSLKADH